MNSIKRSVKWLPDPSYIEVISADQIPSEAVVSSCFCFIVDQDNKVLFIKNKKPYRSWEIPGGHVEPGETALECVVRECEEESSSLIKNPTLFALYKIHNLDSKSPYFGIQYQAFFYTKSYDLKTFKENEEISERAFTNLDNSWCEEYPELINLFKQTL